MNSVVKPSLANHTERTVFSFAQTLLLSRMNARMTTTSALTRPWRISLRSMVPGT